MVRQLVKFYCGILHSFSLQLRFFLFLCRRVRRIGKHILQSAGRPVQTDEICKRSAASKLSNGENLV